MGSSIFTPLITGLQGPTFATENNKTNSEQVRAFWMKNLHGGGFHREDSQKWKTQKGPVVFLYMEWETHPSFQMMFGKFNQKKRRLFWVMLLGEQPFMNVAMAPPIALGWCIRRSWGIQIPHFGAAAHDSFQNKMAQKNRFLPDESAWPFVYPQTLGGHLYNLSTNCHFLSSPKKCHGWIFTSYRCFFEFVWDWVIEWFLSPAFKRGIETKKPKNHRWAVCFWSYSDCVCWHLFFFQHNFPANGWNLGERSSICFLFWSGREIWHNIIWSSTIHKFLWSNAWRMNHLSAPFFWTVYDSSTNSLQANHWMFNSHQMRDFKVEEIQQVYEDTRSCEITSCCNIKDVQGGEPWHPMDVQDGTNKLQMEPLWSFLKIHRANKNTTASWHSEDLALESRCFFFKHFEGFTVLLKAFFQESSFFGLKNEKNIQRSRLEVVVPTFFWDFDKKHFQHFWWPLCEFRWRVVLNFSILGGFLLKFTIFFTQNSPFPTTQAAIFSSWEVQKNTEKTSRPNWDITVLLDLSKKKQQKHRSQSSDIDLFDRHCSNFCWVPQTVRKSQNCVDTETESHQTWFMQGSFALPGFGKKIKQCQSRVILMDFEGSSLWILHEVWVGHIHIILT